MCVHEHVHTHTHTETERQRQSLANMSMHGLETAKYLFKTNTRCHHLMLSMKNKQKYCKIIITTTTTRTTMVRIHNSGLHRQIKIKLGLSNCFE